MILGHLPQGLNPFQYLARYLEPEQIEKIMSFELGSEAQIQALISTLDMERFCDAHLDQPLTLSVLAHEAALSEFHFARMFRHTTGEAPHQFVMRRRMDRARMLLERPDLTLTAIALQCGFHSSAHFSHRFRQVYGTTPSACRRALS